MSTLKSRRSWGSVTVDSRGGELRKPALVCTKGSVIETARGAGTRSDAESIQHTNNPEGEQHAMMKEPGEEVHARSREK